MPAASRHRPAVLIVSYLFPPAGGIAVQRALSLAKYLPESGFDVHVLTAHNASAPVRDPGLRKQVPECVTIHGAFAPEVPFALRQTLWKKLNRGPGHSAAAPEDAGARPAWWKAVLKAGVQRAFCPEPEIWWVPFAVRAARRIIRRHRIEIVLITVPPFSALVAGNQLKRQFPHIRLVSDFRDEWLSFYLSDFDFQANSYTRRRAEQIERETIERSDLVVAVTQSSMAEIRSRYPAQPANKFAVIQNGYDPAIFANFHPRPHGLAEKVVVTHAGTAYKTASPRYYLDALDRMREEIRSRFETRFVGRIGDSERTILDGRKSAVRLLGFVPQADALRLMEETDILLLTMTDRISLPGKLFEYLATGKPILAITPPGSEVHQLMERTRAGWSADPSDPAAIQNTLEQAVRFTSNRQQLDVNRTGIQRYERQALTETYGDAMRALLG